jgi:IPT/TIG domain-containing protein
VGVKFLGRMGRWPALAGALAIFLLPALSCSCPSTPSVTSLSPSSASAGGVGFTLTVNGRHFDSNAAVVWNGTALTTSFVSNTQLTASVPSSDIANLGPAEVFVYNPGSTNDSTTVGSVAASDNTGCGAAGSNETAFTVSP